MCNTSSRIFIGLIVAYCTFPVALFAGTPFDKTAELLPADVYPSRRTAIQRLVEHAMRELRENPNFMDQGMTCDVSRHDLSSSEFNDLVTTPLKSEFNFSAIRETSEPKADEHTMTIDVAVDPASNRATVSFGGGRIGTQHVSAKFVEKPWADDWATFVNSKTGGRWIASSSPTPGTNSDEAMLSARTAAVPQLLPLVQTELRARAARRSGVHIPVTAEWVQGRVTESLLRPGNDGILVVDRFVQKFSRPYGDVWQAQVLIDASPKIIGQLADSYTNAANRQFGRKAAGAGAVVAMTAVLGLLYAFVNAVTKGYFMWRLRAVAFLAAIAGVLIVFAVV